MCWLGRRPACWWLLVAPTLQESRELGVSVGDVGGLAVNQSRDDVTQRRQRQVDLGGLLQTLALTSAADQEQSQTQSNDHTETSNRPGSARTSHDTSNTYMAVYIHARQCAQSSSDEPARCPVPT